MGEMRYSCKILSGDLILHARPRHRILLKLILFFGVNWRLLSLLRAVMKLWMSCKELNYLSNRATVSFLRKILFYGAANSVLERETGSALKMLFSLLLTF
jgi:hypothetical protein